MPNQYDIICEILGQPANEMTNPVNEDYLCPFRDDICVKRSHRIEGPYPVCSVFRKSDNKPIVVCPKRLYAANIFNDVLTHCWTGPRPNNPFFVHEIKMGAVGNVDMVVFDMSEDGETINDFISVELQAVDITGTYEPAYSSIVLGTPLETRPTYNFNYKNVEKRFITQLINKGFYHHHWGTKIVAVVQDVLYDRLISSIGFPEVSIAQSNVIFMSYSMVLMDSPEGQRYELQLNGVTGTTHSNLMMSSLYQTAPPKEDFCNRILKLYRLGNG